MSDDIKDLQQTVNRLRADLSATNSLLLSLFEAIPPVYQEKVLPVLAAKMTEREQLAGQSPPPAIQEAATLIERAIERLWLECQAAHRRSVQPIKPPGVD